MARLAAAHLVKPSWLLGEVAVYISANSARVLNGACATTVAIVKAVEDATTMAPLAGLTLLPFKKVMSSINSLASTQRWCPRCLREWQLSGIPPHWPLLWCLTTVRWCERHQCQLASYCPNPDCGLPADLFAPPGRCRWCGSWLGLDEADPNQADPNDASDVWFTDASSRLLQFGQDERTILTPEHMQRVFRWFFEVVGNGSWDGLRKRLGFSSAIVYSWRTGRALPSLDMFLTFCHRLNLEPEDLLNPDAFERLNAEAIQAASFSHRRAAPRRTNRHPDLRQAREFLERTLQLELSCAPGLNQVADDLCVGSQVLRYHFPELARAVSHRWHAGARERSRICHSLRSAI